MNGPLKFLTARNECSLARAPQIFALLASSQSKFFISARARKKIAVLGMLANARKDHSLPLTLGLVPLQRRTFDTIHSSLIVFYVCKTSFHLLEDSFLLDYA